jgi:hypothetical protein
MTEKVFWSRGEKRKHDPAISRIRPVLTKKSVPRIKGTTGPGNTKTERTMKNLRF